MIEKIDKLIKHLEEISNYNWIEFRKFEDCHHIETQIDQERIIIYKYPITVPASKGSRSKFLVKDAVKLKIRNFQSDDCIFLPTTEEQDLKLFNIFNKVENEIQSKLEDVDKRLDAILFYAERN